MPHQQQAPLAASHITSTFPPEAAGLLPQPHAPERTSVISKSTHSQTQTRQSERITPESVRALQYREKIIPSEGCRLRKVVSKGCGAQLQKVSTQFFFRMMC